MKSNTRTEPTFEELDQSLSLVLQYSTAKIASTMADAGMIDNYKEVSVCVLVAPHGLPVAGGAVVGNPTRMANAMIRQMLYIVKKEEAFEDVLDLLTDGVNTLSVKDKQMYLDFAAQMNDVANAIIMEDVDHATPSKTQ